MVDLFGATKKGNEDASILILKGMDSQQKGNYLEALEMFMEAYKIDPNNVKIYEGIAYSYYRLRDGAHAKKYVQEAFNKGYKSGTLYNTLGLLLVQGKNYTSALDNFNKAIDLGRPTANFFANRASALYYLKRFDEAMADIDRALAIDPNHSTALFYRAMIQNDTDNKDQAVTTLNKILNKNPKNPDANALLSKIAGVKIPDGDSRRGLTDFELPSIPKETFTNIAGMDHLKETLTEAIIYPLKDPALAKEYGVDAGGGILLYGPPGCGKTFIMKATAGEAKVNFINAKVPDMLDMWIGNSEKNIHNLFELARHNSPCVLFFDEIDALGGSREGSPHSPQYRLVVNSLLTEFDGAESDNSNILIIGATNMPWIVDNALKRQGRLGKLIYVPAPDEASRKDLFKLYLTGKPTDPDIDLSKLASLTDLCSCADISAICEEAAKIPWSEAVKTGNKRNVSEQDLLTIISAYKKSLPEWYGLVKNTLNQAIAGEGLYAELMEAVNNYSKMSGTNSTNSYA